MPDCPYYSKYLVKCKGECYSEAYKRFREWGIADRVVPLHADANHLPLAEEYFDAVVSIHSFHYFATQPGFFQEKILPLVKPGEAVILAMPGLAEEIPVSVPEVMLEWLDGEESEYALFHSKEWWQRHIGESGEYFAKRLDGYLSIVGMVIRKEGNSV